MKKRLPRPKFLIGGALVVIALAYLGYQGFTSSASYFYTVDEFFALTEVPQEQNIRVSGIVAAGSIEQKGLRLKFSITGTDKNLPVVYEGAVPDSFKAGVEAVVDGKLDASGVFMAKVLTTKCASKYTPE
jgi:cytochrome c-type biogenesis protein CcmE